jgi:RimJ/RimL family protein N-acetyltransferase
VTDEDEPFRVLTDRLVLRPVGPTDRDELYAIKSDPEGARYIPQGRHQDRARTTAWIERCQVRWDKDGFGFWAARLRDGGALVGVGGVERRAAAGFWNLFYHLDPAYQGSGYAGEIARAGVGVATKHDPELPLIAWIHERNTASQAVAARLGLRNYGRLHRSHWKDDPMECHADRVPPFDDAEG